MSRRAGRRTPPRWWAGVLLCATAWPSVAQVDESALKVAFVYNIAAFTRWPTAQPAPMAICTDAGPAMDAAMASLAGRSIGARRIEVKKSAPTVRCDVLVHGADSVPQPAEHVLVVCDGCRLPNGTSAIALVRDGTRVRFDVDLATAQRHELGFSSQLLGLARRVL